MDDLRSIRKEYNQSHLSRKHIHPDPFDFFRDWMNDAIKADEPEPTAMTLSTVSTSGQPSSRVVLLKGFDDNGFDFYTNYESHKAEEMAKNPKVGLAFFWTSNHRQVRIEGEVEKLSFEESEQYFQSRPKNSQIAAWASSQSEVMKDHTELMDKFEEIALKYKEEDVLPCPPFWGGYKVRPTAFEFWQGRPSRLHDRFRFEREGDDWNISRLWP